MQGIYHDGTRFINKLILTINGVRPLLLSSTVKEDNEILSTDLTNPFLPDCQITENTVHISRTQFIRNKIFYEEINCIHYGDQPCNFRLSITFDGDFKDIFEIRGIHRKVTPNKINSEAKENHIRLHYMGLDEIARETEINISSHASYYIDNQTLHCDISLQPKTRGCH